MRIIDGIKSAIIVCICVLGLTTSAKATLFGINGNLLLSINPTTGTNSRIGFGVESISSGIAFAPSIVPEPTTLAIFGIGLFGLAGMRRRRNTV